MVNNTGKNFINRKGYHSLKVLACLELDDSGNQLIIVIASSNCDLDSILLC